MASDTKWIPQGVIPAVLLPFHEDLSIDVPSFRAHLRDVASVEGLSAITVNAHSTEVASCSFDEQKGVLAIAKMAAEGGAAALLVFPPGPFTMGQRPEMAVEHFRRVAGAADLPIIAFQYPLAGGQGYPLATLLKIVEAVPQVAAIKDWCASPQLHERQIRTLQSLTPPVNVLTTHSSWLMSSLVMGANGLLSGSGSVIADLQARLFRAVRANDLATAKEINDRIWPTAEAFYTEPWVDMHNRMKEALVMMGKLPRAVVRPPLVKIPQAEIERIRNALIAAGLLDRSGRALKAA